MTRKARQGAPTKPETVERGTSIVVVKQTELVELIHDAVQTALDHDQNADAGFLGTSEVADMIGISKRSVAHYVRRYGLPARKIGRFWRFRREEVLAWLDARTPSERK